MIQEEERRFNELMYGTGVVRIDIIDGTKRLIHDIEERMAAPPPLPETEEKASKSIPPPELMSKTTTAKPMHK